jgi:ribosomal protein L30E
MQIVNADLAALKSAARRGRTRSPETLALIQAIESLQPGRAKAVIVEAGQTPQKARTRLMYAAKTCDVKLQVAIQGDRVLFALGRRRRRRS